MVVFLFLLAEAWFVCRVGAGGWGGHGGRLDIYIDREKAPEGCLGECGTKVGAFVTDRQCQGGCLRYQRFSDGERVC